MNFTTDLPKRNPYVTYVVASAMRAHLIEDNPIGKTGNRLLKKFSIINIYTSKQTNFSIQASKFKIQTNSSASNFGIKLYLT